MLDEHDFSITTERADDCQIVTVRGELDELNAEPLEQILDDCRDGLPVVVDLSAVSFVCSASLHVLLKQRGGARPVLVGPNHNVAKVLDIVDVNRTTEVFQDLTAARASLHLVDLRAAG